MVGYTKQIQLLLWKNIILESRRKILFLLETLLPLLIPIILIFARQEMTITNMPNSTTFDSFSIFNNVGIRKVYYYPNSTLVNDIMNNLTEMQSGFFSSIQTAVGFSSEDTMITEFDESTVLCAISFDINSKDLQYSLRFPYKLRESYGGWKTRYLFPLLQTTALRNSFSTFGDVPDYFSESFIFVQRSVDLALLRYVGIPDNIVNNYPIVAERFPFPPYKEDSFNLIIKGFLPFLLLVGFLTMELTIIRNVGIEKEKRLTEYLRIVGVSKSLQWLTWALMYITISTISCFFITILCYIRFGENGAVLPKSNPFLVFVYLILYCVSFITLSFFVSTLFNKANTGALIGGVIWFLSYAPYIFIQQNFAKTAKYIKILSSLLINVAMGYGSFLLSDYEGAGNGLQFYNFADPPNVDDDMSMLEVYFMLILDSFLYMVLALYIEAVFPGEYGVPKKFYFFLQKSYWCPTNDVDVESAPVDSKYFESDIGNLKKGIEIKGLRKVFGKHIAIDNSWLNLYNDEICVLLGHNGAGKSTTISILTGLLPPTKGTALVNGFDITTNIQRVRENIGFCPQHDILFDNLTVEEHLMFFGKLKGMKTHSIKLQSEERLTSLSLFQKWKSRASQLSGGMKRKLSLCISILGDVPIVILDEPTSGMDPNARRQVWDFLNNVKKSKTILLTTHFMDEADALGDRVAIMANGVLQCYGTTMFLKSQFGIGYSLRLVLEDFGNPEEIFQKVSMFIPSASMEQHSGSDLTIKLPIEETNKFADMLEDLEKFQNKLGIQCFGISLTTLEEVFLKVGNMEDEKQPRNRLVSMNKIDRQVSKNDDEEEEEKLYSRTLSTHLVSSTEEKLTGPLLYVQQFVALLLKKMLHTFRNWKLGILQILFPVTTTIFSLVALNMNTNDRIEPPRLMDIKQYGETITFLKTNSLATSSVRLIQEYLAEVTVAGSLTKIANATTSMQNLMINQGIANIGSYTQKAMVGFSFDPQYGINNVIIWFNNQALHTFPLTLNMFTNMLLKLNNISDYIISVTNYPLPETSENKFKNIENGSQVLIGNMSAIYTAFGFSFLMASFVQFLIKESTSGSKHLQFVSGVHRITFWLSTFVWDMINYFLACFLLVLLYLVFDEKAYLGNRLPIILLLFLVNGWALLPCMYCLSRLFKNSTSGLICITIINIVLSIVTSILVQMLNTSYIADYGAANILKWIFLVTIPQFSLPMAFVSIQLNYGIHDLCKEFGFNLDQCELFYKLYKKKYPHNSAVMFNPSYIAWEDPGVGPFVLFLFINGILYWIVLTLIENHIWRHVERIWKYLRLCKRKDQYKRFVSELHDIQTDPEVAKESERIDNLKEGNQHTHYPLILNSLRKNYNKTGREKIIAVNEIDVVVSKKECFGLLGVNGAGKTTTFKMITGDIGITSGDCFVGGYSVKSNLKQAQQNMGYCPQFDALVDQMTGRELLKMYALLHGIPLKLINTNVNYLIKTLNFEKHANKLSKHYSGGNKRKLSTAIALVGSPPLILLDEPTTGMDPGAKRRLWGVINALREEGLSIVLTSHSMEECEALCTRLAIMVNGSFRCLGSPQALKSRYSNGYILLLKVGGTASNSTETNVRLTKNFIEQAFENSELHDEHQALLEYYVSSEGTNWAKFFRVLEDNKDRFGIQDYGVSQSNLEQIFLMFARDQNEAKNS